VTAKYNGSIKLVRRDKTVILASDEGVVEYRDNSSWNSDMHHEFYQECADPLPMLCPNIHLHDQFSDITIRESAVATGRLMSMASQKKTLSTGVNQSTSSALQSPMRQSIGESNDFFVSLKSADSKYHFQLSSCTAHIEDYEYNCFDVDLLQHPLEPKVCLAGQVEGLKPKAVCETPVDPRVFVLNRYSGVREILSINAVSDIERHRKLCPEASKSYSQADEQHFDLNPVSYHTYITKRRSLIASNERYRFEEIFQHRDWLHVKAPSTLQFLALRPPSSTVAARAASVIMEKIVLVEQLPLSQQGYKELEESIVKWQQFTSSRQRSIQQFTVHDPRSKEQLEEESKIQSRLKKVYKLKKKLKKSYVDIALILFFSSFDILAWT
jgi:hypothetical protein